VAVIEEIGHDRPAELAAATGDDDPHCAVLVLIVGSSHVSRPDRRRPGPSAILAANPASRRIDRP
jgi:hypothetical protein